jgi:hypothetical protein
MGKRKRVFGIENEFPPIVFGFKKMNGKKVFVFGDGFAMKELPARFVEVIARSGKRCHRNKYGDGIFLKDNQVFAYVDCEHVEVTTPECTNPREVVAYDKFIEDIMAEAITRLNRSTRSSYTISASKSNYGFSSISVGNFESCIATQGTHENYSITKNIPSAKIDMDKWMMSRQALLASFLATRPIVAGNGCVFGQTRKSQDCAYILSQRANFIVSLADSRTRIFHNQLEGKTEREQAEAAALFNSRALINTKDEPLADDKKYLRLHLVCGDANMAEWSGYLKMGTTGIFLSMLENGFLDEYLNSNIVIQDDIVKCFHNVVRDTSCTKKIIHLADGSLVSSAEHQLRIINLAKKYFKRIVPEKWESDVLQKWEYVVRRLIAKDINALSDKLDWAIKLKYLSMFMKKNGIASYSDPRVRMFDFQYHELHPERSIFKKLAKSGLVKSIITEEEREFVKNNPPNSRALWRKIVAQEIEKVKKNISIEYLTPISISWDVVGIGGVDIICKDPFPPTKEIAKMAARQVELMMSIFNDPKKVKTRFKVKDVGIITYESVQ